MDRHAFIDLIAHEKLATRYSAWTRRAGVDRQLLTDLAATALAPAPVRRMARERLAPPPRVVATHTSFREAGAERLVSREDLYELVWSEPMTTLAKRFGLSDNGLRKRCKSMDVPTPPRGYWERTKHGHRVKRPPLPRLKDT